MYGYEDELEGTALRGTALRGDEGTEQLRSLANLSPYGAAANLAYDNRKGLAKLFSMPGHALSAAAKLLHRAKSGDPSAKAKIVAVHDQASRGDSAAQRAITKLRAANSAATHLVKRPFQAIANWYRHGIT